MSDKYMNKFDTRLIRRNVGAGIIENSEVESHLKSLPDDEANAEWVTIDQEETEVGDMGYEETSSQSLDGSEADYSDPTP